MLWCQALTRSCGTKTRLIQNFRDNSGKAWVTYLSQTHRRTTASGLPCSGLQMLVLGASRGVCKPLLKGVALWKGIRTIVEMPLLHSHFSICGKSQTCIMHAACC